MLKIKVKPEDFIVEEVANISLTQGSDFSVYLLKKRGWNTVDVLKTLSKKLNLPSSYFSYGGKKDKYALTTQYITIGQCNAGKALSGEDKDAFPRNLRLDPGLSRAQYLKNISEIKEICENNYSLSFVGNMDRPMGPDLIKGNKFHIVVRNLTGEELSSALGGIERVKNDGYPNYFDDQRFGSFDSRQGFIAEKILKKHYNGALKVYFSRIHPEDSKEERSHRKFIFENWGNWQICLENARSKFEKESFQFLTKNPMGFLPILQRISHEEMVLFFSAYQSHLWNEVLRKIIKSVYTNALKIYEGIAGNYYFYTQMEARNKEYLRTLIIPMPASNIKMPDTLTKSLYLEVLQEHQLRPALFNIKKLRQAFFKGIERRATIIPENLIVEYSDDEIYPGKKKLILDFFLPRGCFGTMFVKRIFNENS
ncbi:MAG: tRNA pseudouridine(13) synthase TruD [Candidatus Brocadiaceae bacterium]